MSFQHKGDHDFEQCGGEATLGDVLREVWAGRVWVLAGLVIGLACAFGMMEAAVPHYAAQMVLAPASPMEMGAARDEDGAGKNAEALSYERFEASFKGVAVAGLLLRDPEITAGLAADKAFGFSKSEPAWSAEKLAEYIARRVEVDPVGESSLRVLRYLHPDKEFGVMFLQRLHNVSDGLIRHGLRREVNERIAYLNKAVAENNNPEHRRALTDLLMEQERLRMLVSIDQPYAASVVVPAAASVKVRWPDVFLVYAGFGFAGALVGFVLYSARRALARDVFAVLPQRKVKQQEWFFPESGNNNEKPRPLTEKAARRKKTPDDQVPPSEAAE